ncbi:hypothetical protein XENOCAPTIV_022518 [Xenoophorus captivus]|uniref:Uncharacterized protein n=1 Tax=Xenoophorus captivus TaxID=1517983 RepID=A0ABV0QKV3_9TELE
MSKKQAPLSNYFGVPPPPKKSQTESEPQKKRVFSEKWLQEVSWLQANDERRPYRENPTLLNKSSAFYTGTKNFSHPAFDKHANSREHQKGVQAINENRCSKDQRPSVPLDKWKHKLKNSIKH